MTRKPELVYIVLSIGEDASISTVQSILANAPGSAVVIHSTIDVYRFICAAFPTAFLYHSCEKSRRGIYNAMNDALRFLYSDSNFIDFDYFCYLNSGDFLPQGFTPFPLLSTLVPPLLSWNDMPVVLFGHQSVLTSRRTAQKLVKTYIPPLHYSWHNVFRGGQFCHQASYFPLSLCRFNYILFDISLHTFADLGFVVDVLRSGISIKTYPSCGVIYDPKGLSSQRPLSTSMNKFKYLCFLPEFSFFHLWDLLLFALRSFRRLFFSFLKRCY